MRAALRFRPPSTPARFGPLFVSQSIASASTAPQSLLYATRCHKPVFLQRAFTTTASAPAAGADDVLLGYLFGNSKATEVAHLVWKHVVRTGDVVIDATCGNGYDTLALLRMVTDDSGTGCVYGFDIQDQAVRNTSLLLDDSVTSIQKQQVKLFPICHSRMEDVVPVDKLVRLVAFNLGYLPGGEKSTITRPETTLLALEAAKRRLAAGGLISAIVYVGHPGGREEYAAVEEFASQLPVEEWNCSKLQMLNRPAAPIVVFIYRK